MPGLRRINQTKVDPRTRRGLAMLAQDAQLLFGDGLETVAITGISGGGVTMTLALADPSGLVKSGGLAVDPKASGGLAIDTDGVYIVLDTPAHGQHLSLSSSGLSIDDDYVFNTGDSMTGALDITDTTTQFTLKYDGSNTSTFTVGSGGDLSIVTSGGDISFNDENITTTGKGTFGELVVDNIGINDTSITSLTNSVNLPQNTYGQYFYTSRLTLVSHYITSSVGYIDFDDDELRTSGNIITSTGNITATNGVVTANSLIIDTGGAYDFRLIGDSYSGVCLENVVAGHCIFRQFTHDGDGVDYLVHELFGYGTKSNLTNNHYSSYGWDPVNSYYWMKTGAAGSQTVKPLRIFTGTDTDQIVVNTNGRIGIQDAAPAQTFDVNGTINAISGYYSNDLQGWSGTFTNGDGDTVTVTGGIITDVS
jgi:hypothetical protein